MYLIEMTFARVLFYPSRITIAPVSLRIHAGWMDTDL